MMVVITWLYCCTAVHRCCTCDGRYDVAVLLYCCAQVLDRAHFLPQIGSAEDTRIQYSHLCQALDEFMHRTFAEFTLTIPKVCISELVSVDCVIFHSSCSDISFIVSIIEHSVTFSQQ